MQLLRLESIPWGDQGTYKVVATMRELARQASIAPNVRQTAVEIVRDTPPRDQPLQARLIGEWIGNHVRFLPDPTYAEALHEPAWAIAAACQEGIVTLDCDDVAMMTAALGLSIGLAARFVVVGFGSDPRTPFRHVWTDLGPPDWRWYARVDPTRPQQGLAHVPIARSFEIMI